MFQRNNTIIFSLITIFHLTSCMKNNNTHKIIDTVKTPLNATLVQELKIDANKLSYATAIIKTVHGNITFKFYPSHAPNTVSRIIQLINEGFYDGLSFHRVIDNFIVQTGDPTGSGRGGTGKKLKAEFSELQHILGTVSMARSPSDIDSADSQFYISLGTLPQLDRKYTIFGQVVDGLNTLKKISEGDKIISAEFINKK